eukprot:343120-Prymnesium_polylepis.1
MSSGSELSEYEMQRAENIVKNHTRLVGLGLARVLSTTPTPCTAPRQPRLPSERTREPSGRATSATP